MNQLLMDATAPATASDHLECYLPSITGEVFHLSGHQTRPGDWVISLGQGGDDLLSCLVATTSTPRLTLTDWNQIGRAHV